LAGILLHFALDDDPFVQRRLIHDLDLVDPESAICFTTAFESAQMRARPQPPCPVRSRVFDQTFCSAGLALLGFP